MDLPLKILLALGPVPIFYLIYRRYSLFEPQLSKHVESFLAGIGIAAVVLLLNLALPERGWDNSIFTAFGRAAFVEKLAAFLVLLYMSLRPGRLFNMVDAGAHGIMLGLGFSFLENMVYSLESNIVLIRLFSTVPLHLTTCGILGYYTGLARLQSTAWGRWREAAFGFLLAWVLHGFFDWALLFGGAATYWAGPALIVPVFILDYLMARAKIVPPLEILEALGQRYEDWLGLQRQAQYERWILRSMGSVHSNYSPLFEWRPGGLRIAVVLVALALAAFSLFVGPFLTDHGIHLKRAEVQTFFLVLPLFLAANLMTVGIVNPDYFKNSIIRIPIVADVEVVANDQTQREITYDMTTTGCFLKTVEEYVPGDPVELVVHHADAASPPFFGTVVWDNHRNIRQQFGTIVAFGSLTTAQRSFLRKYRTFKLIRGVAFNLKLPGFEAIRRLFLRPESVMQDEKYFPAGTVLFREGDAGNEFFMVKKGRVEIYRATTSGTRTILGHLEAGQIFGEMAITGSQPRNASAVCETDAVLAVASGDDLTTMIRSNPDFARELIRLSSMRIHTSSDAFDRSIAALEEDLVEQRADYRAALMVACVGLGGRVTGDRVELKLDLLRACDNLNMAEEEALALLRGLLATRAYAREEAGPGGSVSAAAEQDNQEWHATSRRLVQDFRFRVVSSRRLQS